MKIKTDFVTNSSSSCYILAFDQESFIDFDNFLDKFTDGIEVMQKATTLEELDQMYFDSQESMLKAKELMNKGGTIISIDVSDELGYGLIECTKFDDYVVSRGC